MTDSRGRVCLVTGATSGIGLATAVGLAERGATVLMAGPDAHACASAMAHVRARLPAADLRSYAADLSQTSQVRRLADEVAREHPRLHVLINNAGVYAARRVVTQEGHEQTWAVNYLAPFALTTRLLPNLLAAGGARVINVSSVAHAAGRIDLDDLDFRRRRWHGFRAYAASKLALLLFSRTLAARHDPVQLTSNALHPGIVGTGLVRSAGLPGKLLGWAMFALRSPGRGAETSVHLAHSPDVRELTGEYFVDSRPARISALARDAALAEHLWQETEAALGATVGSAR